MDICPYMSGPVGGDESAPMAHFVTCQYELCALWDAGGKRCSFLTANLGAYEVPTEALDPVKCRKCGQWMVDKWLPEGLMAICVYCDYQEPRPALDEQEAQP